MGARTVTLPNGTVIRIRPYRPDDRDQVIQIFSQGMMGLAPGGVGHVLCTSRPLQVFACAAPVAALLVTPRRSSFFVKVAASLSAAAFLPCLAFGMLRRALYQYVLRSINGPDLSSIETYYSSLGAGHGSAFWVAELVEPEPWSATSSGKALLPRRTSPFSLAASSQAVSQAATSGQADPAPNTSGGQAPTPPSAATGPKLTPAQAAPSAAQPSTCLPVLESMDGNCGAVDSADRLSASTAPTKSADADERRVHELVSGLVAAAVARFEAVPRPPLSPSPSVSPRPTSTAPPALQRAASLTHCNKERDGLEGEHGNAEAKATMPLGLDGGMPSLPTAPLLESPTGALRGPQVGSLLELSAAPTPMAPPVTVQAAQTSAIAAAAARPAAAAEPRRMIIGHVALERKSWKVAELRRMSVLKQYGGQGIGGQLLETLVRHAHDVGFRELVLSTSGMQPAARRLYERGGWRISKVDRFQNMDVYMYTLDLTKKS